MPLDNSSTDTRCDILKEVVLYQGESAKKCHQKLFSLHDSCYRPSREGIVASILSLDLHNVSKLHISAGWEAMLEVALWTLDRPTLHDVISLLKRAGVGDDEVAPFREAEVGDIFPWLYYGNRFDVLRKICSTAKMRIDSKLERKKLLVYCHLSMDGSERIIASNL